MRRRDTAVIFVEDFWARFDQRGGPNACWEWQGARNREGYGTIKLAGENIYTHVLAWETHNRKPAHGRVICHSCDNPPCGNPRHLRAGSHGDNLSDQWHRKRRVARRKTVTPKLDGAR